MPTGVKFEREGFGAPGGGCKYKALKVCFDFGRILALSASEQARGNLALIQHQIFKWGQQVLLKQYVSCPNAGSPQTTTCKRLADESSLLSINILQQHVRLSDTSNHLDSNINTEPDKIAL